MTLHPSGEPRSVERPGGGDVRHDLLTPLNQIIGYSEMLLEESEDSGDAGASASLMALVSLGRDTTAMIDRVFPATDEEVKGSRLVELCGRLVGPAERILRLCDDLHRAGCGPPGWPGDEDLGRIRAAAKRLSELAGRRLDGGVSGESPAVDDPDDGD